MAYQVGPAEVSGGDRTFVVRADVDITRYMAVIQSSPLGTPICNEIDVPAAIGDPAWGIAQEEVDYSEGQHHCRVRTMGFSKALAFDGDIVAGDFLMIGDTSGRLDTAAGAAGNHAVARACEASAAQDDLIVVQMLRSQNVLP